MDLNQPPKRRDLQRIPSYKIALYAMIGRVFKKPTPQPTPRLLRPLAILHIGITAAYLAALPPAPQVPPILIPLVWAASYATTLTAYSLLTVLLPARLRP